VKYLPPVSCLLPSNMPKAEAFILPLRQCRKIPPLIYLPPITTDYQIIYHQISVSIQQSAFSDLHQKSLIDSSAD
jgi:hypothetical protein